MGNYTFGITNMRHTKQYFDKKPRRRAGIRRAFVINFFAILILAVIVTIICELLLIYFAVMFYNTQFPTPIKTQIADDETYARNHASSLLARNPTTLQEWNTRIQQAQGTQYVIVDSKGNVLAGNVQSFSPLPSASQLGKLVSAHPVTNGQQRDTIALSTGSHVDGYLLLRFPVTTSTTSRKYLTGGFLLIFFAIIVLLPFVFLLLAALLFAWLTGRRISKPVDELMVAIEKIQHHDLNFHIDYDKPDELGDLCRAFNELRAELQQSLEREWRQQEEMRDMIAALSHDLRTPVTIIQGHVEGLARAGEKRSERLDRYLPVLEASTQRMSKLLNDMLLVASMEQVGFLIRPQPVCLQQELACKAHIYELRAQEHGIHFSYEPQCFDVGRDEGRNELRPYIDEDEQPIMLDLHRIEQVLDNLFENALRYTPVHGSITLGYTKSPSHIEVTMRDTGCGIALEDVPHIFEKFYHGKHGTQKGNAGLGLYICKQLVEWHGGSIVARNCDEGGCEMRLFLSTVQANIKNSLTTEL